MIEMPPLDQKPVDAHSTNFAANNPPNKIWNLTSQLAPRSWYYQGSIRPNWKGVPRVSAACWNIQIFHGVLPPFRKAQFLHSKQCRFRRNRNVIWTSWLSRVLVSKLKSIWRFNLRKWVGVLEVPLIGCAVWFINTQIDQITLDWGEWLEATTLK